MKCSKCGTETDGNFCTNCGAKIEAEVQTLPTQQVIGTSDNSVEITNNKKTKKGSKKPFYKKWWFIGAIIILVIISATSIKNSIKSKFDWNDIVLSEMLPEPPSCKGKVISNTSEQLNIDIENITEKEYEEYVTKCKELGFDVDSKKESSSYDAYNNDGYKLELYLISDSMSITLNSPMEMDNITWPSSTAGYKLPTPESEIGKFEYEYDDSFSVYIGNTTQSDYADYVNECNSYGFEVDYKKDDDYYHAYDEEGYYVTVTYQGYNIMKITIEAPDKSDDLTDAEESTTEETTEKTTVKSSTNKKQSKSDNDIDPDFKKAMDSYEEFMFDYVDFIKDYNSNPSDLKLIAEYSEYLINLEKVEKDFEKLDEDDMTDAELAYYIDVQARVNKKMLELD